MPKLCNSLPPHCHAVLCRGIPSPISAYAQPNRSLPPRRVLLRIPSPALLVLIYPSPSLSNAKLIFPLPARCPAFPVFSRPVLSSPCLCPCHATLCHAFAPQCNADAQQCHAFASALRCDALPMHRKSIPRPSVAIRCYASPLPGQGLAMPALRQSLPSQFQTSPARCHPLPSPCFSPHRRRRAFPRKATAFRRSALPSLFSAHPRPCAALLRVALPAPSWSILRLAARRLAMLRPCAPGHFIAGAHPALRFPSAALIVPSPGQCLSITAAASPRFP